MTADTIHLEELPYHPDSSAYFESVRQLPGPLLLDSSHPHTQAGRFDILTADPVENLEFYYNKSTTYEDVETYFRTLLKVHSNYCGGLVAPAEDIPFCGGIAGYIDYALGAPLQHLSPGQSGRANLHFYDWALVQDHLLQRCTFVALPQQSASRQSALLERLRSPRKESSDEPFELESQFQADLSRDQYREALQRIQRYILAGDCYQANFAQRFSASYRGDPWQAYLHLRPTASAPFAGYMRTLEDEHLLCLSPERFLALTGHHVETRPIKGTRPRHNDPAADRLAADELRMSPKDRAENLMIVDLLRNDLGRNCVPGSIRVDRLFELESYPTVHHLVSTVSGELLPGRSAIDLLRDSFPGGSITGAPKRRSMEIIEELEPQNREAYCGSMLYISADGRMDSNIAIRSLRCSKGEIVCWGGGGIVADSEWEHEYQETWDKVGRFMQALETTRL